jgi:hypothetical protein
MELGPSFFTAMNVNTVKMRFIDALCPPALLYLLFVTIQIALDVAMGSLMTAGVKTVFGIATVFALDALCGLDLGIVSWAIVATPFIVTSLATAIAMGLDADRIVTAKVKEAFESPPTKKSTGGVTEESQSAPDDYPFSTNSPIQE